MENGDTKERIEPRNSTLTFFRGFFIRLLYGSLALPFIALVRPDFLEEPGFISLPVAIYLIICVAGGFYDVETRDWRRTKLELFGKPKVRDIVLFAMVLIILWSQR